MSIGFFRKLRRNRVIRLDEDLLFGVKKVMRERWDLLTVTEFYQNLEELEQLLKKEQIVDEAFRSELLENIKKIKRDYPFDRRNLPKWDTNFFLSDVLWFAGSLKQVLLLASNELPSYHPLIRTWNILDQFFAGVEKRRNIMEDEEKRLTSFILVAVKKHVYYLQFFINILIIIIGIIIGWIFTK